MCLNLMRNNKKFAHLYKNNINYQQQTIKIDENKLNFRKKNSKNLKRIINQLFN